MRNMGNSGKTAFRAILAALALLVLTGITLHETVFLWFLAACATAYVACVVALIVRRRHKTLAASGLGSILFIAFGIAFLRQWGLAFNPDPEALSTPVDSAYPDLYFYLAALSGAATLLLLFAGMVLPGRGAGQHPRGTPRRRPASRPATSKGPVPRASRPSPATTSPARRPAPAAKRPATARAEPAAKRPAKPPVKPPARPAARGTARR